MIFSNSDEVMFATEEVLQEAGSGPQTGPGGAPRETGICGLVVMWILEQEPTVGLLGEPNYVVILLILLFKPQCR